ncbi:MAG: RsmE family RNA methyltransferase [Gemmatimonadaceae bacterium]
MIGSVNGIGVVAVGTGDRMPDRAAFFTEDPLAVAAQVALSDADTRHAHVLRLGVGERVGLRDGIGTVASGLVVRLARTQALVEIDHVRHVEPPAPIHLMVPIADRDRMLWLAEKAAELNVASWRPVLWQRSRSVSPRGDGPAFRSKVRVRMIAALVQSRSAWLPYLYPDANVERAIAAAPSGTRLVLDAAGVAASSVRLEPLVTLAVGPEGGFEPEELQALGAAGFISLALGDSVLRFETAAVAGVAVARSMLTTSTVTHPTHS